MSNIFIQNPTDNNVGVQIVGGDDFTLINNGPDGAVNTEGNRTGICLAPYVTNTAEAVSDGTVELEGTFVIQVGNKIVPHSFTPDQLPIFFNGTRPECFGIKFEKKLNTFDIQFTRISTGEIEYRTTGPSLNKETIDPNYNWVDGTLNEVEQSEYIVDLHDRKDLIVAPSVNSIAETTFIDWINLGTVDLQGGGVVGTAAFANLSLSKVSIGSGVTAIEAAAFVNNSINTPPILTFKEGINRIESSAFSGWINGTEINLPQSIRYLANGSFNNWLNCSKINLGGLIEIAGRPFGGVGENVNVPLDLNMGTSLKHIGTDALGYMTAGNKLTISPVLEHIETGGLSNWGSGLGAIGETVSGGKDIGIFTIGDQSIHDVDFPSTLKQIDNYACQLMRAKNINLIGNDQLIIGEGAFQSATAETLKIGQGLEIKDYAFQQMFKLSSLDLGLGITNLTGNDAFQLAHSLETVTIPGGCKVVAGGIFNSCSNLSNVVMDEGIEQIGLETVSTGLFNGGVGNITEIVYPNSVLHFYGDYLGSLNNLESVYFGNNLDTFVMPNLGSSVRSVYVMSPFKAGFTVPSIYTPWTTLYLNDLSSWATGTNPDLANAFAYVDKPATAMIPTLSPLEPLASELAWSIQYRNLTTGLVEQIDATDTIGPGSLGSVTLIDEVVINSNVVTILPGAFPSGSIKRFKALPGLVYANGPIGRQRLKEATLPDTVKRLGSPIFLDTSLESVTMPLTGYDSINVEQFETWPEGIEHPTVSVSPATPTAVTTTATEISGSITGLETIVVALNAVGELYGEDITDADGNFTITLTDKTLVNDDVIVLNITDIVGNTATATYLASIANTEPLADEMYFTTTAGDLNYKGVAGDVFTLSDGQVISVDYTWGNAFTVPAGKHKVTFAEERTTYPRLAGPALTEVHNFPTTPSVNRVRFQTDIGVGASNLVKVPDTLPSNITDLSYMFHTATVFNQDISMWDTSNVTNMSGMFYNATAFNQPIGNWNTSNIILMSYMFYNATAFNQPVGSWNVSKVTDMEEMLSAATSFNQNLSQWCVALITSMPINFNSYAGGILSVDNLPVWGTCPRGENQV